MRRFTISRGWLDNDNDANDGTRSEICMMNEFYFSQGYTIYENCNELSRNEDSTVLNSSSTTAQSNENHHDEWKMVHYEWCVMNSDVDADKDSIQNETFTQKLHNAIFTS